MMAATRVETIPPITRAEAHTLAGTEYARMAAQLRSLAADDWSKPTDCPLWDVRSVTGHNIGMMSTFTGFRQLFGAMRAATKASKRNGEQMIDALTARQVAEQAHQTTDALIASADELGPRAASWRANAPSLFRKMPLKQQVGGV